MQDKIAEIKQRFTIGEILQLCGIEPRGGFIFSPFREEKTPSTKINFNDDTFKDFSSGAFGDVIDLFAALRRLQRGEAINELGSFIAPQSGAIQATRPKKEKTLEPAKSERKNKEVPADRRDRLKLNTEIYSFFLIQAARKPFPDAMRYLHNRGLNNQTIIDFRLVTSIDPEKAIQETFERYGYDSVKIAGIPHPKYFNGYSVFIPYFSTEYQKPVYIRARYFHTEHGATPKPTEINGREYTPPKYKGLKNDAAYQLNGVKRFFNTIAIKGLPESSTVYLTEGELDAIMLNQYARENSLNITALAVLGATASPEPAQWKHLLPYKVIYLPDNDAAGEQAVQRFSKDFTAIGGKLYIQRLRGGKDVTDIINNTKGLN